MDRGVYYNEKVEPISAHIFALDGSQWRSMRTKLTPTFTSGKMKMMFNSIVSHSETLLQVLDSFASDDKDINIKDVRIIIIFDKYMHSWFLSPNQLFPKIDI